MKFKVKMQVESIKAMKRYQQILQMMKLWRIFSMHASLKVNEKITTLFIGDDIYKNKFHVEYDVEYDVESSNQSSTTEIIICGFWEDKVSKIAKAIKKWWILN